MYRADYVLVLLVRMAVHWLMWNNRHWEILQFSLFWVTKVTGIKLFFLWLFLFFFFQHSGGGISSALINTRQEWKVCVCAEGHHLRFLKCIRLASLVCGTEVVALFIFFFFGHNFPWVKSFCFSAMRNLYAFYVLLCLQPCWTRMRSLISLSCSLLTCSVFLNLHCTLLSLLLLCHCTIFSFLL